MEKVFVAGCGRSGTTYLRILLNAHDDVFIPLECLFYTDYILNERYLPKWVIRNFFFREPMLNAWYSGGVVDFKSVVDLICKVQEHEARKVNAKIWGQKTPRFVRYIEEFESLFSDTKWILIYRDPRAVVSSLKKSKEHPYSIISAVQRWKKDNLIVKEYLSLQPKKENLLVIKYESLILNFYDELNRVFEFLGLASISENQIIRQEKMLTNKMITGNDNVKTNTIRGGLSPNTKSLTSWKESLESDEVAYIQSECSELMDFFFYEKVKTEDFNITWFKISNRIKSIPLEFLFVWENVFHYTRYFFHFLLRKFVFLVFKLLSLKRHQT